MPDAAGLVALWDMSRTDNGKLAVVQGSCGAPCTAVTAKPPPVLDVAGTCGPGFSLDGRQDFASVPASPALDLSPLGFALGAWVRTTHGESNPVVLGRGWYGEYSSSWTMGIRPSSAHGVAYCEFFDSGSAWALVEPTASGTDARDGQWHFLVCTGSASGVQLYVDGALEGSTVVQVPLDAVEEMRFGDQSQQSSSGLDLFSGVLDQVVLFSRELSSADVVRLRDATVPP